MSTDAVRISAEGPEGGETPDIRAAAAAVLAGASEQRGHRRRDQYQSRHHRVDDNEENLDHGMDSTARVRDNGEEVWQRTGPLLASYREGFASVNGVLSVISLGADSAGRREGQTSTYSATSGARSGGDTSEALQTSSASPPRARRAWPPTPPTPR